MSFMFMVGAWGGFHWDKKPDGARLVLGWFAWWVVTADMDIVLVNLLNTRIKNELRKPQI